MKNVKKKNKFKVTGISPGLIAGKLISQKLKLIKRKKTQIKKKLVLQNKINQGRKVWDFDNDYDSEWWCN